MENPEKKDIIPEEEAEYCEPEPLIDVNSRKSKIAQIILGIAAGIGLMYSLFFPLFFEDSEEWLKYLFLVVFVVEVIVQRQLQKKFHVRFVLFSKVWIFSMIGALVVFIVIGAATGIITS